MATNANMMTTEEFIIKANRIHDHKYDYSKVVYTGTYKKITIICPIHGEFVQTAKAHLTGQRCAKCVGVCRMTTEEFIAKAKTIHGDKYDYSLVEYVNCNSKVAIICNTHGTFYQRAGDHLYGRGLGCGCSRCASDASVINRLKPTEKFIEEARKIHGDLYDYSLTVYRGSRRMVVIICKIHGQFKQIASSHLKSSCRCPQCIKIQNAGKQLKSREAFIEDAIAVHGNTYDYSLVEYLGSTNTVSIICKHHGIFKQKPPSHLWGAGCPYCRESRGERKIRTYLNFHNIQFIPQYRFDDCRDERKLPFDAYIPHLNVLIEYDGIQHFESADRFGGKSAFVSTQRHDLIKTQYAKEKGIRLIRIPYTDYDNIENILEKNLDFK